MKQRSNRNLCAFLVTLGGAIAMPVVASAAGLGNLSYSATELERPISRFGGSGAYKFPIGPSGSNTAMMLRNLFVVMASNDSGRPPGVFHFFDVTNPKMPKLLKSYGGTPETANLRELHAMPVAVIDGKDIAVFPTTSGIQFFDFTDPMNPAPAGTLKLPGIGGGDYDNTVWMLSWAWPYVYVGATNNGVYIVDATDPGKATVTKQITTGQMGNFKVGPIYSAGNYLVVSNMDQASKVSILDVGVPSSPSLLKTASLPVPYYSMVVVGDRIYGPGTQGGAYAFVKWSATDGISMIASPKSGTDRGGYCTAQSGFVICGQSSEGYKKWDVHNESAIVEVGHGFDPMGAGGDFDFATIMGNLVYQGNDHGTGAYFIPHQMAPDTTAPQVAKIYPNDRDVKQPLSTRVTVFLSEDVDIGTMTSANVIVRKLGGTSLAGNYSRSSFNAVSFGTKQPLEANTTYEIVIPAGGLKDLVGNAIATTVTSRFSTGAEITPTGAGGSDGGSTGTSTGGAGTGAAGSAATTTGSAGSSGTGSAGTGSLPASAGTNGSEGGSSGSGAAGSSSVVPDASAPDTGSPSGAAGSRPPSDKGGGNGCACNLTGQAPWAGTIGFVAIGMLLGRRRSRRAPRR